MEAGTGNLSFRRALATDAPAIVTLVESVYRGEHSRKGWTTEADLLDGQRTDLRMILDLIADPATVIFTCEQSGKLLSSVLLQRKDGFAYLGMLSVDVSAQNLKLGRRMMDEAASFIKAQWGLTEIRISVIDRRHELIAWYERRGFKRTGGGSEFSTDTRFGVPKVQGLKFIEMAKSI